MKDKKVSVVSVKNTTMAIVETDESEYCEYIRYSADNWNVRMGDSIEQLYEPENLELAYQEFLENNEWTPGPWVVDLKAAKWLEEEAPKMKDFQTHGYDI